jgi:hypothetical protein
MHHDVLASVCKCNCLMTDYYSHIISGNMFAVATQVYEAQLEEGV